MLIANEHKHDAGTDPLDRMRVVLPEGTSRAWRIERFTVSEVEARLDALMHGHGGRHVTPGAYTRLLRNGTVVMSDTLDEKLDHLEPVRNARGHCLVFGLGLGMVTSAMLKTPGVERVTVVELSPDVIALVAPTLQRRFGERFEIVQADALTWKPPRGVRYDCVWADIWDALCTSNLDEMTIFNRRYGRRSDWHGCWSERWLRYQQRQEARR